SRVHAAFHALDARRLHDRAVRLRWRAHHVHGRAGHAWHSLCPRLCPAAAGCRRNAVGSAGADPHRATAHAQGPHAGGAVVSLAPSPGRPVRAPGYRLRRHLVEAASLVLGAVLLIWSLLPIYNMLLIALDREGDTEFAGDLWPSEPSLESFRVVLSESFWYVEEFWRQFGNSFYVGLATMFLTMLIASLASFAAGRMQMRRARLLVSAPLLSYVLPSSFLAIPFLQITRSYGLSDSLWGVIAAEVMFATPFAVLVLQSRAKLVPIELDEAARVDGASPLQIYVLIYLPLM